MKYGKRMFLWFMMMALSATSALSGEFMLVSPQLTADGVLSSQQVFNGFGCTGKNISPALSWSGEPRGTKSFAVTVYDPDAPTGSGWWHWLVINIPATVHSLPLNSGDPQAHLLPSGAIQTRTDFGRPGYGGACPPAGDPPHRYVFTIWALDTEKITVDADSSGALVGFFLNQHQIGKAELVVTYGR